MEEILNFLGGSCGLELSKDYYEKMLLNGITTSNARHSVTRKMISVMSGVWKTDSKYDPKLLDSPIEHLESIHKKKAELIIISSFFFFYL